MKILIFSFLMISFFTIITSPSAEDSLPRDYAMLKNPLNPSDASALERGEKIYRMHCSKCHGDDGNGKGPLMEGLGLKPFRELLSGKADGYLVYVIENGKGMMPECGPGSIPNLSREDIWRVITFTKTQFLR